MTAVYVAVASATLLATVLCAVVPVARGRFLVASAWLGLVTLTLLAWQWPALLLPQQLNPDESSFLAQAHAASAGGVPWRDFDGTTSGPLNTYVLVVLHGFGLPFSYAVARGCAFVLRAGAIVALYLALRGRWGEATARLAVVPALVFFTVGAYDSDDVHYSSETLPVFLLAVLGLLAAVLAQRARAGVVLPACAGLVAGAVPFAKLQAAPIDAVLAAVVLAIVAARREPRAGAAFAAGCATVPALLLAVVAGAGAWNDFLISYVREPLVYANDRSAPAWFPSGRMSVAGRAALLCMLVPAAAYGIAASVRILSVRACTRGDAAWLAATGALVAASAYAVDRPHHPLGHYLLLVVVPICALAGVALGIVNAYPSTRHGYRVALACIAVAGALLACRAASVRQNPFLEAALGQRDDLTWYQDTALRLTMRTPPERRLLARVPAGTRMAVWGWAPEAYVLTDALLGTRDSQTQFAMWNGPFRTYYRDRFLRDMDERKPSYFLDAVRPVRYRFRTLTVPENRHENDPAVRAYVARRYRLIANAAGLRLYERLSGEGPRPALSPRARRGYNRSGAAAMLTFPQFVDEVNATLPTLMGAAAADVRFVEVSPDEVEWNGGLEAVRAVRQSEVGAMLTPYRGGRRHGPMEVVAMDVFGIEAACALIADRCGSSARLP